MNDIPVFNLMLTNGLTNGLTIGQATDVAIEMAKLLVILLAPFVGFTVIIHWFEQLTQRRLAERFGWHAVLWTGWLGTPIHELSHVFMCRVFQHRIDEIALFEPDRESGRLGYVRHSFKTGNWFQELGNFFIGIAPLLGGSIVLAILLAIFYPEAGSQAIAAARESQTDGPLRQVYTIVMQLCGNVLSLSHWGTLRFWVFIYLVLCVGSHMAPSGSDYNGAARGVWMVAGGLLVVVLGLALAGVNSEGLINGMISTMGPLFAVLSLAIVLCGITTLLVHFVTWLIPVRYHV